MRHVRDAVQRDLEWNRDLLLDLFGRDSRPLRDDVDIIIGNVRIRLDGKRVKGYEARDEKQQHERNHKKPVSQREIDNLTNHYFSTVSWRTNALATTWSPALTPEIISCMLSGSMFPAATSTRRKP